MAWWDDLWLNEGFATFLETVCVDHLQPEWGLLDLFPYSTSQPALDLDSLQTSHPVSARVHDPDEIDALFDSISYNKVPHAPGTVAQVSACCTTMPESGR